jgi:hypothetical protein
MSKFIQNQEESPKQYAHNSYWHDDIIIPMDTVVGCSALTSLVPPRCPKLGLTYLKLKHTELFQTETRRAREVVRTSMQQSQ